MKKNVLNVFTGEFDVVDTQNIEEVLQQPTNEPDGIYVISITGGVATLAPATGQAVGTIQQYASITGIPTNELILTGDLVNKQEVDKVTYAALYAVIGDFHGVPLNPANFVLPPIVGLLPKGGTVLNYTDNGGSDTLTQGQLPIVNSSGTIQVSTNDGNILAANGSYFANVSDGGTNYNGFIANGNQGTTVNVAGVQLNSFGSGQPHEHPYQNFIYTICFESVAYGGVSPTPSLQQVTDVGNTTTNSISIGTTLNFANNSLIESDGDLSLISDGAVKLRVNNNGFQKYFQVNPINTLTQNVEILTPDKSGTVALEEDLPIFLDETSTIADFVTGRTHYYIGEAPNTYDYDLEPYPLPIPTQNFNFVNLSVHDVLLTSAFGNNFYTLEPQQALRDITIVDGGGFWELTATEYIDNINTLQQVVNKGNTTRDAFFVINNPDTYRTRYSTIGTQIQRDDLGNRINYSDTGIELTRQTGNKSFSINLPDITANAINSSFEVDFRPNVSGTVAYLSDITGGANIYNANGTLTGNRTINGGAFSLQFNNVFNWNVTASNQMVFQSGAGGLLLGGGTGDVSIQTAVGTLNFDYNGTDTNSTISLGDNRATSKRGLQYAGFGEADINNDSTGVDYSGLIYSSLVPKKYVDDTIATISNIYNSDGTLTSSRVLDMSTNDLNIQGVDGTFFTYLENTTNNSSLAISPTNLSYQSTYSTGYSLINLQDVNTSIITDSLVNYGANPLFFINNNNVTGEFVSLHLKTDTNSGIYVYDKTTSKKGMMYINFGEEDVNDSTNTADFSTLTWNSFVPKKYVDDIVSNPVNIYTNDGSITTNENRVVTVSDSTLTFNATGTTDGFLTSVSYNKQANGSNIDGSVNFALSQDGSTFISHLTLSGEEGSINYISNITGSLKTIFRLAPEFIDTRLYDINNIETVSFNFSGNGSVNQLVTFTDNRTDKSGITYLGFGELGSVDSTGVDYSSLKFNSLVPKKYVDDSIISNGTLQAVTDNGNITTNTIITDNDDYAGLIIKGNGEDRIMLYTSIGDNESYVKIITPGDINSYILVSPNSLISWNNGFNTTLRFPANSVNSIVDIQNKSGTIALLSDVITGAITEQAHTVGGSVIVDDSTTILYVDPVSTIASLTIIMPANPINGQEVKVSFGGTITSGVVATALAVVGNVGQSVLAGVSITNAQAGDGYIFKFQSSTNLWRVF